MSDQQQMFALFYLAGVASGSGPKCLVVVYDIFGFSTQAKQASQQLSIYTLCICFVLFPRYTSLDS